MYHNTEDIHYFHRKLRSHLKKILFILGDEVVGDHNHI